ncbi:MAG: hypothetical protein R3E34_13395 [Rhodocyclaceae bacterium]
MLLWLVAAYLVHPIGIGLVAAMRVHQREGLHRRRPRNLPLYIVVAMVFATWFGAETVVGISATFLEEGFHGLISDPRRLALCLILFGCSSPVACTARTCSPWATSSAAATTAPPS